jgi:hypothetical protein
MTIKQIAEITGAHYNTVKNKINEIYPEKQKQGKRKTLTQSEGIEIIKNIKKSNFVNLDNNVQELRQNSTTQEIVQIKEMFQQLMLNIPKMIENCVVSTLTATNTNRQIEIKQDYYTILAYSRIKGFEINYSDAIKYGKEAVKLSKEKDIEIKKAKDERYGFVNSYHISVLEEVIII